LKEKDMRFKVVLVACFVAIILAFVVAQAATAAPNPDRKAWGLRMVKCEHPTHSAVHPFTLKPCKIIGPR